MKKRKSQFNRPIKKEKNNNVKIIATLGKNGHLNVYNFYKNGTNILRINGSHMKNNKDFSETLTKVQKVIAEKCVNLEVMYDTQGPEIRTRISNNISNNDKNDNDLFFLKKNDNIAVHTDLSDDEFVLYDKKKETKKKQIIHIGVNYCNFINDVNVNDLITIDNRKVYAKVLKKDFKKKIVFLKVTSINDSSSDKYTLSDRMHINLLGKPVSQPTLTEEDKKYIRIAAISDVKYFAISFVRSAEDIIETRKIIVSALKSINLTNKEILNKIKDIKIIAKIETKQGLDNIEDIIKEADGAMVARGDLSCEIPLEEVPYAKEKIIRTCNKYKKFSILATNVLESLTYSRIPSVNDIDVIVTALKLGVNSIMLSNETAIGKYSEEAIREIKKHIDYYHNHHM